MISPDTIAQVRDRADILAVIGESVPTLKRRGRSFSGLCPFHKEKTPSFHVNPDRGFFHCFGCKESGSVIDFVMKLEGATFPEAVRSLAERFNIAIEEDRGAARPELDRLKKQKEDLYAVNQIAAAWFEEQLRTHADKKYALDELEKRGISPGSSEKCDEALTAFRIGYAPGGWDGLTNHLRASGISPIAAESVGLLVPRSSGTGHYDRFRHRLMFAVVDEKGRVVAFSGRALADLPSEEEPQAEKRDPPPKYINSPESPIYSKGAALFGLYQARHGIRQEEIAVLVEGNFDVVSLHARGLSNVVAPLGTAFTEDQAKLLKRFAPTVVFFFDGDSAGKKAVRASRVPANSASLSAKVAVVPQGKDPDELVRALGVEAVQQTISQAKGMSEFLIDAELDESFVAADVTEKMIRVDRVLKIIAEEDDSIVRLMLKSRADELAGRLDLHGLRPMRDDDRRPQTLGALEDRIRHAVRPAGRLPAGSSPQDARVGVHTPGSPERKAIVEALVECPALLDDPSAETALSSLEGASVQIVSALRKAWSPLEKRLDVTAFMESLPESLRSFCAEHLASPKFFGEEDAKGYLLENANKLKRLLLTLEASELAKEQHREPGDWDAETERAREAARVLRARHGLKA